jgi:hypothetical protein
MAAAAAMETVAWAAAARAAAAWGGGGVEAEGAVGSLDIAGDLEATHSRLIRNSRSCNSKRKWALWGTPGRDQVRAAPFLDLHYASLLARLGARRKLLVRTQPRDNPLSIRVVLAGMNHHLRRPLFSDTAWFSQRPTERHLEWFTRESMHHLSRVVAVVPGSELGKVLRMTHQFRCFLSWCIKRSLEEHGEGCVCAAWGVSENSVRGKI